MAYNEEDYLQLSGIQHFIFCRRQWALIHIEQQWNENYLTVDGKLMHENAHDTDFRTRRGNILTVRALKIYSAELGVSGECDVVEFHKDENGVPLAETEGLWLPYPVEYKRGKEKSNIEDEAQLCGQAMCLEEMLCCDIPKGALYYGQEHHRHEVVFTDELRQQVKTALEEMHKLYERRYTPKVKTSKACYSCSVKDLCLPKLMKNLSVEAYLHQGMRGEEE